MAPDSSTTEPATVLPVLCWAWAGAADAISIPSAITHPLVRQRLMGVLLELTWDLFPAARDAELYHRPPRSCHQPGPRMSAFRYRETPTGGPSAASSLLWMPPKPPLE